MLGKDMEQIEHRNPSKAGQPRRLVGPSGDEGGRIILVVITESSSWKKKEISKNNVEAIGRRRGRIPKRVRRRGKR